MGGTPGDRTLSAAVAAARDVEQALVVEDEARDLLLAARPAQPVRGPGWEQVREAHAALRAPGPRIGDPVLRAELLDACGMLTPGHGGQRVTLAPRALDVPACVASGATNAAATGQLGQAVAAARRAGLLP